MKAAFTTHLLHPSTLCLALCVLFQNSGQSVTEGTSSFESSNTTLSATTTETDNSSQTTQLTQTIPNEELSSTTRFTPKTTASDDSHQPSLEASEAPQNEKQTAVHELTELLTTVSSTRPGTTKHVTEESADLRDGESVHLHSEHISQSSTPSPLSTEESASLRNGELSLHPPFEDFLQSPSPPSPSTEESSSPRDRESSFRPQSEDLLQSSTHPPLSSEESANPRDGEVSLHPQSEPLSLSSTPSPPSTEERANQGDVASSVDPQSEQLSQSSTPFPPQTEGCRDTPPFMLTIYSYADGSGIHYEDRHIPLQSSCNANMSIVENIEETIEWQFTSSEHFSNLFSWFVIISEGYGFVVEFDYVNLWGNDYIEIFTASVLKRNFTRTEFFNQFNALTPLFVNGNEMLIIFHTFDVGSSSVFRVRYKARLNEPLPEAVPVFDDNPVESRFAFLCSGIRDVPDAIMCDGVRHCANGEDETNCSYRQHGCGDWFPYKDHCLKAKFVTLREFIPGHSTVTMPFQAERYCRSEYGATLASLPDPLGINITASMLHVAGFSNAVVGIRKVKPVTWKLRRLHRYLWQWGDRGSPIAYEQQKLQREGTTLDCGILRILPWPHLTPVRCILPPQLPEGFVCMRPNPTRPKRVRRKLKDVTFPNATVISERFPTKACPDGSVVQVFHLCQWGQEDKIRSTGWSPGGLPLFQCRLGHAVHYSLVCDGKDDCADRSDELHCQQPQFHPLLESSFVCRTFQVIPANKRCDGNIDCFDESDEEFCASCTQGNILCPVFGCLNIYYTEYFDSCPSQARISRSALISYTPASVALDGFGMSTLHFANDKCEEGYFRCNSGLCVPTFLVNNGEKDCPEGEDEEISIRNVSCPGYYRCQRVGICVHPRFLCDNIYHCPNKDDELFCNTICPSDRGCTCEGQAYRCSQMIEPLEHLHVRYLDLSHAAGVDLDNIHFMEYLSHLNLSFCHLSNITLGDMPHLLTLDLSHSSLTRISSLNLTRLTGLLYLNLSNNPFVKILNDAFTALLQKGGMNSLRDLVMVNMSLEVIDNKPFSPLSELEYLDIRGNPLVSYGKESLSGLTSLAEFYTDQFKLCCSYFHFSMPRCHAPEDELSSCSDLLAKDFFRVFLWTFSVLAIAGNAGVLVYRLFINSSTSRSVFSVLVKNLCASDLLMGVYMMMIGVADARLKGQYVAKESEWTSSVTCTVAGFLSFVSSEVSAFIICLITLDRVLVISFPLHTHLHLTRRLAISACCLIWILGVALAAVPILTGMEFYGQNGICVPLPITRRQFSGQSYAFGVFIVLNFVIFVFIGLGQLLIYRAVRRAGAAAGSNRRQHDMAIARRLFLVVFTDFCCWFPIGVLGLLASSGTPISGSVNAWAAIFVLPLNSALNPFLYTLNSLMERWNKRRAEQRIRQMLGKLRTEIPKWQPASVQEVVKICAQSKAVSRDALIKLIEPTPRAKASDDNPPHCLHKHGELSIQTDRDEVTTSGHCCTTETEIEDTK